MTQQDQQFFDAIRNDQMPEAKAAIDDIILLLVENGGDIHGKDNRQLTPLYWAILGGHISLASVLIGQGADIDTADDLH